MTWDEARTSCQVDGGDLMGHETESELDAITNWMPGLHIYITIQELIDWYYENIINPLALLNRLWLSSTHLGLTLFPWSPDGAIREMGIFVTLICVTGEMEAVFITHIGDTRQRNWIDRLDFWRWWNEHVIYVFHYIPYCVPYKATNKNEKNKKINNAQYLKILEECFDNNTCRALVCVESVVDQRGKKWKCVALGW